MIIIDTLCYGSALRNVNVYEKFLYTVTTMCICIAGQSIIVAAVVFLMNGILSVKKGGISLVEYMKLLRIPFIFLLLSTGAIIVNISHVSLDLFAIELPINGLLITGSRAGMVKGFRLIATAMAAVSCLYFLSLSTPITDILYVFKKLKCPKILIELMLLVYRFIFILLHLADTMQKAQLSRLSNINMKAQCHAFAGLGNALMVRAIKKSNVLYDAMESRCYDGDILVLHEGYPTKISEIIFITVYEAVLLVLLILSQSNQIYGM